MIFSKILVPLDGSPVSEQAIRHAESALPVGGEITLFSVVSLPEFYATLDAPYPVMMVPHNTTEQLDAEIKGTHEYLETLAEALRRKGLTVYTEVKVGEPITLLREIGHKYDAIVMSTHGRNALGRLLYGSVTRALISNAPCPIIVIPAEKTRNVEIHEPQPTIV
ncbi:MAG: universal stress protein [Phototrophicaceae bacterium]|jgi:nucleotide-binding universal stress UspA family protein